MATELEKYTSGHLEKGVGYKYFVPSKINDQWLWKTPLINTLLEKASVKQHKEVAAEVLKNKPGNHSEKAAKMYERSLK